MYFKRNEPCGLNGKKPKNGNLEHAKEIEKAYQNLKSPMKI
jgi:hypothetical protein